MLLIGMAVLRRERGEWPPLASGKIQPSPRGRVPARAQEITALAEGRGCPRYEGGK